MGCFIFEMVNHHKTFDYEREGGDRQKLVKKIKAKEYKLNLKLRKGLAIDAKI